MMDIRFHEHDGMLQEDGLPKIVVVGVNGVRFPFETHKSIAELYRAITAMKAPQAPQIEPLAVPVEVQPVIEREVSFGRADVIERNDIVRYKGVYENGKLVQDPEGELVAGNEYTVLEVKKSIVALIDHKAAAPIRLTVFKTDVDLVRKGPRVTHKKETFERLAVCPACGEQGATEMQSDGKYKGSCLKCKGALAA